MLSQQRKLRLGMIKGFAQRSCGNLFPSAGAMARLATLRKTPVVRIAMTIGTFPEGNPDVAGFIIRAGRVAFLASHLYVQTGKRVLGL